MMLLNSFLSEKAAEEALFSEISSNAAHQKEGSMISVDEYRKAFGEDWQLSQFW